MSLFRAILAGVVACLMATGAYAGTDGKKTVTLGTCYWPPYIMEEKSGGEGYAYDVVKQAFLRQGYHVVIKIMNWDEAKQLTKEGKLDGLFPEYHSKDNLKYFIYSDHFLAGPLVLYQNMAKPIASLPDTDNQEAFFHQLKDYRFGAVKGYVNVPAFDDNKELIKIEVPDDKSNLEQLYNKKVDFILIDKLNAQYLLNHDLPEKYRQMLKPVGPELAKTHFYVIFSKAIPNVGELIDDFNDGLEEMQEKKLTHQIMARYIHDFIDVRAVPKKIKHQQ